MYDRRAAVFVGQLRLKGVLRQVPGAAVERAALELRDAGIHG